MIWKAPTETFPGQWPECAQCSAPVDTITQDEDRARRVVLLTVAHHGETETVAVPWDFWTTPELGAMQFGQAFVAPKGSEG